MSKLKSIDHPNFRFWQAWYMAFYSRRLYIDVSKRWRGYGFGYLFGLIFLASIPLSLHIIARFNQDFDQQMIDPIKRLPDIYIQDGKMSIDEPMPYLIKDTQGHVVAVIDEKAYASDVFKFYPKISIFINKDKIYFRPPQLALFSRDETTALSKDHFYEDAINELSDGLFNGADWVRSSKVEQLKWYTDAMVFPAIAIFFFSMYIVILFGVTLVSQGFSWVFLKIKFKFKEASRLCLVATTPQVFIFFTFLTLELKIPGLGVLQVVLFSLYFSFAALSVKRERKGLVFA